MLICAGMGLDWSTGLSGTISTEQNNERPTAGWACPMVGLMKGLKAGATLISGTASPDRSAGPEVVGDEPFELVAGGADGVHGGDDRVAGVLGVGQGIALGVLVGRLGRAGRSLDWSSSIASTSSLSRAVWALGTSTPAALRLAIDWATSAW